METAISHETRTLEQLAEQIKTDFANDSLPIGRKYSILTGILSEVNRDGYHAAALNGSQDPEKARGFATLTEALEEPSGNIHKIQNIGLLAAASIELGNFYRKAAKTSAREEDRVRYAKKWLAMYSTSAELTKSVRPNHAIHAYLSAAEAAKLLAKLSPEKADKICFYSEYSALCEKAAGIFRLQDKAISAANCYKNAAKTEVYLAFLDPDNAKQHAQRTAQLAEESDKLDSNNQKIISSNAMSRIYAAIIVQEYKKAMDQITAFKEITNKGEHRRLDFLFELCRSSISPDINSKDKSMFKSLFEKFESSNRKNYDVTPLVYAHLKERFCAP